MRDITDLVGLACVRTAQNGANRKIPARICADTGMGKRKEYGTARLLSHHKKLSDGDRIAGRTRRTFET